MVGCLTAKLARGSGSPWRWFMRNPEILRALQMVGMEKTAGSQQSSVGSEDYRLTTAD
jgi:hypothetical protein